MISDVLSDAVSQIEQYRELYPDVYGAAGVSAVLDRVQEAMRVAQSFLDGLVYPAGVKGTGLRGVAVFWTHGAEYGSGEDEIRARDAAMLALAGVPPMEAEAAFIEQLDAVDCLDDMTGLAALWRNAERAADLALTHTWNDPDAGGCRIASC